MIKLFTHNDLDGIGCAILASLIYGTEEVSFETCGYDFINDKITEYIDTKDYLNYTKCFITDISISDALAERINSEKSEEAPDTLALVSHFQLLDHHITASHLNNYSWCRVEVTNEEGVKCSGTSLFYHFIQNHDEKAQEILSKSIVTEFVEKIRRYDTWDWAAFEDIEAKQLNDLFYILGKERFIDYWLERLQTTNETFYFDDTQKLLLEIRQNEIDKYIDSRDDNIIVKDILTYKAGIVFADRFQSELGNKLAELHPELDFIAMINVNGGVSCRTVKEDINLGEDIAKVFGGGGHAKAAGLPVTDAVRELVINAIFNKQDCQ